MRNAAIAVIISNCLVNVALAEDWQLAPLVEISGGYDDNIRLRQIDDSATEASVEASLAAVRSTEISETRLDLGAGYTSYSGADADDLDDLDSARFIFEHRAKFSERMGYELLTSYTLDSVGATARFDTEEVDADEALTRDEVDRQTIEVSPRAQWELTEFSNLSLGVEYRNVEYSTIGDETLTNLVDYDYMYVSPEYARDLSERSSIYLQADYFKFDSDGEIDGDAASAMFSFERKLTENTSFTIGLGGHTTEIESETGLADDSSGLLYMARYRRTTELGRLDLIADRVVTPSGRGSILERDAIRINYRQKFSEKFEAVLQLSFVDAESIIDSSANQVDRSYVFLRPRIDYNLNDKWSIGASYRFRQNDDKRVVGDDSGRNDSNGFFITLKFEPPSEINQRY